MQGPSVWGYGQRLWVQVTGLARQKGRWQPRGGGRGQGIAAVAFRGLGGRPGPSVYTGTSHRCDGPGPTTTDRQRTSNRRRWRCRTNRTNRQRVSAVPNPDAAGSYAAPEARETHNDGAAAQNALFCCPRGQPVPRLPNRRTSVKTPRPSRAIATHGAAPAPTPRYHSSAPHYRLGSAPPLRRGTGGLTRDALLEPLGGGRTQVTKRSTLSRPGTQMQRYYSAVFLTFNVVAHTKPFTFVSTRCVWGEGGGVGGGLRARGLGPKNGLRNVTHYKNIGFRHGQRVWGGWPKAWEWGGGLGGMHIRARPCSQVGVQREEVAILELDPEHVLHALGGVAVADGLERALPRVVPLGLLLLHRPWAPQPLHRLPPLLRRPRRRLLRVLHRRLPALLPHPRPLRRLPRRLLLLPLALQRLLLLPLRRGLRLRQRRGVPLQRRGGRRVRLVVQRRRARPRRGLVGRARAVQARRRRGVDGQVQLQHPALLEELRLAVVGIRREWQRDREEQLPRGVVEDLRLPRQHVRADLGHGQRLRERDLQQHDRGRLVVLRGRQPGGGPVARALAHEAVLQPLAEVGRGLGLRGRRGRRGGLGLVVHWARVRLRLSLGHGRRCGRWGLRGGRGGGGRGGGPGLGGRGGGGRGGGPGLGGRGGGGRGGGPGLGGRGGGGRRGLRVELLDQGSAVMGLGVGGGQLALGQFDVAVAERGLRFGGGVEADALILGLALGCVGTDGGEWGGGGGPCRGSPVRVPL